MPLAAARSHPLTWRTVLKRALVVAAAGVAIYLVLPSLTEVLATLLYRLASYWLPLLAGPPAYLLFRHRYGGVARRPASGGGFGERAGPGGRQKAS